MKSHKIDKDIDFNKPIQHPKNYNIDYVRFLPVETQQLFDVMLLIIEKFYKDDKYIKIFVRSDLVSIYFSSRKVEKNIIF